MVYSTSRLNAPRILNPPVLNGKGRLREKYAFEVYSAVDKSCPEVQ